MGISMDRWLNYVRNSWPRPGPPVTNEFLRANTHLWTEVYQPVIGPLILAALLLGITAVWLLRKSRRPEKHDVLVWFASAGFLAVLSLPARFDNAEAQQLRFCGFAVLGAVNFLGLAITLRRLNRQTPQAFLPDTVVAGVVLVVLAAVVSPPVGGYPRSAAHRTTCRNNLKQIGLALHNYHDVWTTFPSQKLGDPPQSWRVAVLPYVDHAPLYREYQHDQPWDSDANAEFSRTPVPALQCPAQRNPRDAGGRCLTSYAIPHGPRGIWRNQGPLGIKQITDGTSNTLAVVEACGQNIVWNEPRDIDLVQTPFSVNARGTRPFESPSFGSSYHRGGVDALLADGSVRFLPSSIDPVVLRALTTADGGEGVSPP
jgi:hypothetical protein